MAMCSVGERLVLFGGVGAAGTESILDVSNDCWVFDPASLVWREVEHQGEWPSPRRCVGVAPTASGLFLWGGSGLASTTSGPRYTFLNDWWHFNPSSGQWSQRRESDDHRSSPTVGAGDRYPCPRYTPVFASVGEEFVLFGGYTEDRLGKRKLNDAWVGDGADWTPVPITGAEGYASLATWPGPRYGCMSAASGSSVFVCGGFSDTGDHNDLWQFDLKSRQWRLLMPESADSSGPVPRYCAALAYDRERLFLFGGRSRRDPKANYNDLWVFDLHTHQWQCLSPNRSPHRYDAGAAFPAYHAKSSAAVVGRNWYVWGGEGQHGHVSDFWRFSLNRHTWELVQAARDDDPRFW